MPSFRLDAPADPRLVSVVDAVVGTFVAHGFALTAAEFEDFTTAVTEAALDLLLAPGVSHVTIEGDDATRTVVIGGEGVPREADGVLGILGRLARVSVRRGSDGLTVGISPR